MGCRYTCPQGVESPAGVTTCTILFCVLHSLWKVLYLEVASWIQFRWSQFYWQHPKTASQSGASWTYAFFSSTGLIRVLTLAIEPFQSLFTLVLAGLDIHSEPQSVVVFCLLPGWCSGDGELVDNIVVKLVSPRIFGPPPEPRYSGWWNSR